MEYSSITERGTTRLHQKNIPTDQEPPSENYLFWDQSISAMQFSARLILRLTPSFGLAPLGVKNSADLPPTIPWAVLCRCVRPPHTQDRCRFSASGCCRRLHGCGRDGRGVGGAQRGANTVGKPHTTPP